MMKMNILINLCAYFSTLTSMNVFVVLWDFSVACILDFSEGTIVALLFERVC